ncbi:MAG: NAD(P) transhydrogenase subunit alpha [Actinoplanes sp.]
MTSVGVLREMAPGERRVALTPDAAGRLRERGLTVLVESGAGRGAWFGDEEYGPEIKSREQVYAVSDVLLCVGPPPDASSLRDGQTLVGLLGPPADPEPARRLAAAGVTLVSLDLLPRTLSRAQSMDALTSQANVAGYKAAIVAAEAYGGFFPMLMTAAGTTRPAQVLVLGAGVAGLQAIATARRLGALVTGFDVREQARADIASTGAAVLDLGGDDAGRADGYAAELGDDRAAAQRRALGGVLGRFDVVITTAQVPGRRPPLLIDAEGLAVLRPGAVVVDLGAGPLGGNVAGAAPDGVTVIGAGNLAASVPRAASTAYARNVLALLAHLMPDGVVALDPDDEIQRGVVLAHGGRLVREIAS